MAGKVILVGAGPGDPGLITIRGMDAIRSADVIVYDYLANPELLACAPESCELLYVGKKGADHTLEQNEINELLVEKAKSNGKVVRLKGGDPYIFGRGSEEMEYIVSRGIEVEVVPGIPAAIGAGAFAGIPLTDRRHTSTLAFITGHEDPSKEASSIEWDKISTGIGTLVFYMGVKNLPEIASKLVENGRAGDTPVSIVEWATTPKQRVVTGTLATIADVAKSAGVRPPALTIVGEVNNLRESLKWFERLPLFGRKIVVTRSRTQASELSSRLRSLGADVVEMPTIEIAPPENRAALDDAVARVGGFDWVVFTSVNGAEYFMQRLRDAGGDARVLAGVKVAAIGPATAKKLNEFGIIPDYQPSNYVAESIFEGLAGIEELKGKKFLLPRADIAREALTELLKGAGAIVEEVTAYRTLPAGCDAGAVKEMIAGGEVDAVTFTSSSTARNFVERLGADFVRENKGKFDTVSIGPVTTGTLRSFGMEPAAAATEYTIPGLVDTLVAHFEREEK